MTCRNGLHEKTGPGLCGECRRAQQARYRLRKGCVPQVPGMCRNGLHEKNLPGRCPQCWKENRKRNERKRVATGIKAAQRAEWYAIKRLDPEFRKSERERDRKRHGETRHVANIMGLDMETARFLCGLSD